jgi:glycosyltransferase involved in cell wall biosynthesis
MALGLPVIATKVPGPDVYIKEGQNGYFCEPTVASLLEKMEQLASCDVPTKASLSTEARITADRYDIKAVAASYQDLFLKAATCV